MIPLIIRNRAGLGVTLARLRRDARGGVMLEFALLAPMFLATLMAILQLALVFLAQQGLETAAEGAGRMIMTGQAQKYNSSAGMTQAQFKQAICGQLAGYPNLLPPFLACSNLYVDVQTSTTFSGAVTTGTQLGTSSNTTSYNTGSAGGTCTSTSTNNNTADANGIYAGSNFCTGAAGAGTLASGGGAQVVTVRLSYLWPTISVPFGLMLSNHPHNTRELTATSVLVTESYS